MSFWNKLGLVLLVASLIVLGSLPIHDLLITDALDPRANPEDATVSNASTGIPTVAQPVSKGRVAPAATPPGIPVRQKPLRQPVPLPARQNTTTVRVAAATPVVAQTANRHAPRPMPVPTPANNISLP